MLVKELKEILKDLPNDTDVIMQKRTEGRCCIFAEILEYRLGVVKDEKGKSHKRFILINDKPLKGRSNEL